MAGLLTEKLPDDFSSFTGEEPLVSEPLMNEALATEFLDQSIQSSSTPSQERKGHPYWAGITAYNVAGKQCGTSLGVVVDRNLVLCRVSILLEATRLEIRIEGKQYSCQTVAGWDLERGYCLLPVNYDTDSAPIDTAQVGEKVTAFTGAGTTVPCRLDDPASYDVSFLSCYVTVREDDLRNAFFLLDNDKLLGIAWYQWPFSEILFFGQLPDVGFSVVQAISIVDWQNNVWRNSLFDRMCRGRDAYLMGNYEETVLLLGNVLRDNPTWFSLLYEPLARGYIKWADNYSRSGDLDGAITILKEGLEFLGDSREILFLLSREEATSGYLVDALDHMKRALALDEMLWERHWPLLEKRYSQLAASLDDSLAVDVLLEGIRDLPLSSELRVELGGVLFRMAYYAEAVVAWEEAYQIRPDDTLAKLIEKARGLAEVQDDVVIVPFSSKSETIRGPVVFDQAVEVTCIIDTGASYTAMPPWAAESLGIDLERANSVKIATASGVSVVPVVTLNSVSIGSLEVGPLDVLILKLPNGPGQKAMGLLGMNYLKNFHVLLDKDRKELRISPR